jgi:hypothetical protein
LHVSNGVNADGGGIVMWMKMMAFGATASILALSACAVGDEETDGVDTMAPEPVLEEMAVAAPRQFCGGIAAITCPAGSTCVEDTSDSCDPARGGADCGGVCVADREARRERRPNPSACRRNDPTRSYVSRSPDQCRAISFRCVEGKRPFFNECGCGCQEVVEEPCGNNVCGAGTYCCNASCGICAPEGGVCIQRFCGGGELTL